MRPGSWRRSLPPTYTPRRPTETVLYNLVRQHLESFLAHVRENYDGGLPRYVEQELRGFLKCGVWTDGSEMASMNAGAPEADLPDWSPDGNSLAAHVTAYFVSMGVATCEISGTDGTYSAGGGGSTDGTMTVTFPSQSTVGLVRSIDGVPVVESIAFARFDSSEQTTSESFYWPTIPADVVTASRAFHDKLAAPGALAAYKAKLPADAQGDGQVVIHHRVSGSSLPFTAVTTYDTVQSTPEDDGGDLSFDPDGNRVTDTWEAF